MVHRPRLLQAMFARGILLWGVVLLLTCAPSVHAQLVLRESLISNDPAIPIQFTADGISLWTENGLRVFWLRGNVLVSQGENTTIRTSNLIVWVDQQDRQDRQAIHVTAYSDKTIQLEVKDQTSPKNVRADSGYVRLQTTGKLNAKAIRSELVQEDQSNDPVYQQGRRNLPEGWSLREGVVVNAPARAMPSVPGLVDEAVRPAAGTQSLVPPAPPVPENLQKDQETNKVAVPSYSMPQQPTISASQITPAIPPNGPQVSPVPGSETNPVLPFLGPPPTPVTARPMALPVQLSIRPRYKGDLQFDMKPQPDGMTAVIVTGGVNVTIHSADAKSGTLDIEADRMVIWTRSNGQQLFSNLNQTRQDTDNAHELYLSGNVEIRTRTKTETETLRAEEIYYDVRRSVAVARRADLELMTPKLQYPIHVQAAEMVQENKEKYSMRSSIISSSILPYDPGLVVEVRDSTIEERKRRKTQLYGLLPSWDAEGQSKTETNYIFTGRDLIFKLEGWPIFYFPYLRDRVDDPLGPLEEINLSYNRIFGFQIYTTLDLFDILDLDHPTGQRWRLNLDYLTQRGPAIGTEYEISKDGFLGTKAKASGTLKLYAVYDQGEDILGGDRGRFANFPTPQNANPINHPTDRGWAYGKYNLQDLPNGFTTWGQFSFLSDRNFLEQYFLNSHLNEMNQDTYLYVKQQQENWAWSIYGQISTRDWVTETDWLPRLDGNLIGQTLFDDLLVYNASASAGYARLLPTQQAPFAYLPTDVRTDAARLDLRQELSLPFYVGPVKVAPYVVGDLAYYTHDVNGDNLGRAYGGVGLRWSLPFSRLYSDVQSDLFNLNGLYHKINLTGNYFLAQSSSSLNRVPQFQRLNDDATDQALRDIRPYQTTFLPGSGAFLTTSNLFNPQNYALRRLLDNNPDNLDSMDVVELGLRQRWQTKRGTPDNEHVVDWMTLNLNASIFPHSERDNFGHLFGILEYDWKWNIGDRTALVSSGWYEPVNNGPRVFDLGSIINRPDNSSFYIGYRQIDPIESKAVIAAITYPLSAKYAMTASTVWDFGVHVQSYSLMVARMGTDVMVSFGVTYNSTLNTFGLAFEILPNLARRPSSTLGQLFQNAGPNNAMTTGR